MKIIKKIVIIIIITLLVFFIFNYLMINKPFDEDVPDYEPEPVHIIDSEMTFWQATKKIDKPLIPEKILRDLSLVNVEYYGHDNKLHKGQIVVHRELENDIKKIFSIALKEKYPIYSVIPVSHKAFSWNDDKSMIANNTSAFNYRESTGSSRLSQHAYGCAIDINPLNNPYIKKKKVLPKGAVYDKTHPAVLTQDSIIVKTFLRLGWTWGGNWKSLKDYQHFEKKIK